MIAVGFGVLRADGVLVDFEECGLGLEDAVSYQSCHGGFVVVTRWEEAC